jgi:hypothetical protein
VDPKALALKQVRISTLTGHPFLSGIIVEQHFERLCSEFYANNRMHDQINVWQFVRTLHYAESGVHCERHFPLGQKKPLPGGAAVLFSIYVG